jgi:hypothetical protein
MSWLLKLFTPSKSKEVDTPSPTKEPDSSISKMKDISKLKLEEDKSDSEITGKIRKAA